ncbi:hypothetical protein [Pontibacterium sp.]|uniref:hypothetical protein n=1 Tax=Pontibacterium sp. TaxID=2036026 RepID=UPI00351447A1
MLFLTWIQVQLYTPREATAVEMVAATEAVTEMAVGTVTAADMEEKKAAMVGMQKVPMTLTAIVVTVGGMPNMNTDIKTIMAN